MRSIKTVVACVVLVLGCIPVSEALLVEGDSGSSSPYTNGTGAGVGWDYVGSLIGSAPSSVSYVSNGWFVTANHVWTGDVVGRSQETLQLDGNTYSINTSSYTPILNADDSSADLCMFRVSNFAGLPEGMAVSDSTPGINDDLRLIGNGYDNDGNVGLTWGNGTTYETGSGRFSSTLTIEVNDTICYLSVYDAGSVGSGSAYGQTYDSGGGVFTDGQLGGIMIGAGTYGGDEVTFIADFSTYGEQINATTAAIPEPSVLMLGSVFTIAGFCIRRVFQI